MQALAILLSLAAAACLYLAAPNQLLVVDDAGKGRSPLSSRLLCWTGLLLAVAGTWVMSVPEGWPVAIAATLVVMTCFLSFWPFIGTWLHHSRTDDEPADAPNDMSKEGSAS
ncbi:hypothetical protein [Cupriavidus agavae]|uniref:DUF3325 domain-containing protein n=1 Tax=Cupriavidus agavae TaxID=1001822 RepID=A0A4Q7S7C6_9BURK|nr:hypothetical protein [Cupriavidus agavae]RZT42311.1 hypothetical protein EV147_1341 [Cupriavidus agavae]